MGRATHTTLRAPAPRERDKSAGALPHEYRDQFLTSRADGRRRDREPVTVQAVEPDLITADPVRKRGAVDMMSHSAFRFIQFVRAVIGEVPDECLAHLSIGSGGPVF